MLNEENASSEKGLLDKKKYSWKTKLKIEMNKENSRKKSLVQRNIKEWRNEIERHFALWVTFSFEI